MTHSRPRFLVAVLLLGAFAAAAPGALFAAPPSVPDPYESGTRNLKNGRWFERAETQFEAAVTAEPDNFRHHLALGCARASRASSLAHAAFFASGLNVYRHEYPQMLAEWEAAQKDPQSDEHGDPRPTPPPPGFVFRTKDDQRPFRLTLDEARAQVAERAERARTSWNKAVALARTPAERAEAQYVRGWGLRLLTRHDRLLEWCRNIAAAMAGERTGNEPAASAPTPQPQPPQTHEPRRHNPFDDLVAATRDAPQNALYWQSLGDALGGYTGWSADVSPVGEGVIGELEVSVGQSAPAADTNKALAAYQKSLALNERNAALWYHLSRLLRDADRGKPDASGRSLRVPAEPALDALRQAGKADTGNAFAWYGLAGFGLLNTRYSLVLNASLAEREQRLAEIAESDGAASQKAARAAIADLERGNRAGRYVAPLYAPAVPDLLRAAWNYGRRYEAANSLDTGTSGRVRELARAACSYALVSVRQNRSGEATRACRAVIGMGLTMMNGRPAPDQHLEDDNLTNLLTGSSLASTGYLTLKQVCEQTGDRAGAAQAAAQYDEFRLRNDEYLKALTASLAEEHGFVALRNLY